MHNTIQKLLVLIQNEVSALKRHLHQTKAKEAAAHAHKGKKRPPPTKRPPQNATTSQLERWRRKKNRYNQQQDYKRPESHPDSKYPEPHFHEGQKPDIHTSAKGREINTHHSF